jgi:hypothetical protein
MKTTSSILLALSAVAFAQNTIYGPTGLNFVPSAFASEGGRWSGSLGGTTDDDPLWVSSLQGRFLEDRLEIGLSSTAWLVEGDSMGWKPRTTEVPLVPSARWILDRENRGIQSWGYAVGVSMPLGAWAAAGWRIRLPVVSPELHAGFGTPLNSIQGFGGVAVDLCDLEGNPLPLRLTLDGAISGSTGTLGSTEEAYWSAGVSTRLGRNLTFQTIHRRDRSYAAPDKGRRPGGTSFLRILWNFGSATNNEVQR